MTYRAPLKDMLFDIRHLAQVNRRLATVSDDEVFELSWRVNR